MHTRAAEEIGERGERLGLRFFQFSFVDLFGVQRSKLVPAARVKEIASGGERDGGIGDEG